MVTQEHTEVAVGDTIELAGRRVGDVPRAGKIVELLGTPSSPHYRVRWADGHESILFPGGGTRIVRARRVPRPQLDLAAASALLVEQLETSEMEFELLPHRRTSTAASEARVLGVLPQATAKTVIARDETGARIRAVVPASAMLDLGRLTRAVDADTLVLLTEDELAHAYPEFELGAVPPFGGAHGERVVVDRRLAECDHVVFDAGVHDTSLRLRTEDLIAIADAQLADIVRG